MKRAWMMGLVLMSGCATIEPGKPLNRLPPGVNWCNGDRPSYAELQHLPDFRIPTEAFRRCSRLLTFQARDEDDFAGTIVLGLSSDDAGVISSVCVWSGDFGDATDYVACMAEEFAASGYVVPARLQQLPYTIHHIIE